MLHVLYTLLLCAIKYHLPVFTEPSGVAPPARSACHLYSLPEQGKIVMYGGYSKDQVKKVSHAILLLVSLAML